MSRPPKVKLNPRNFAALRRGAATPPSDRIVAGNPVTTRLESAIGNCYPGLECDLRNLERRFFPFLAVDIDDTEIRVVSVDMTAARDANTAGTLTSADFTRYRQLSDDIAARRPPWRVTRMAGTFGVLGTLSLNIAALRPRSTGAGRLPPDAWVAIRMLTEGTPVTLDLAGPGSATMQLVGNRNRYLDDNGALSGMFVPGEMTQSLCSPWTQDFRDCGCYYWASNRPDIAQPPRPTPPSTDPRFNAAVTWLREDRASSPPAPATRTEPTELGAFALSTAWQQLNFVVGRRETVDPFTLGSIVENPLATRADLEQHLRYAAGVELTVALQYLTAAYSLRDPTGLPQPLRNNIRASHAELMRIAIGEMRHLRAVNDVLRMLLPSGGTFTPALRPAASLPTNTPGTFAAPTFTAANRPAIQRFIDIEAPSVSVDSIYARILATLVRDGLQEAEQLVRTIMAEGGDHFDTFRAIQVWLSPHAETDYLRVTTNAAPPAGDADHAALQTRYLGILTKLHAGYTAGNLAGAANVNGARNDMIGTLDAAARTIAGRGFLVIFDTPSDARFTPIPPP